MDTKENTQRLLQHKLINNVETNGDIRNSDFRKSVEDNDYLVEVRDLGIWESDDYEEDDDFQSLSANSYDQIRKVIKEVCTETGREIDFETSEKNWITFEIR